MERMIGGLDVVERCSMWPSSNMTSFETKTSLLPWKKITPIPFDKVWHPKSAHVSSRFW